MQPILELIKQKARELDQSGIMNFIRDQSIDPRQRFIFAPIVAPWALSFGDINKFVLRDETSKDPIQKIINTHTQEDDHHWKFFLKDLQTLGLNDTTDFCSAVSLLWSDECQKVRQLIHGLTKIIGAANPRMRLVIVEAVETAGNVCFRGLSQTAEEFRQKTGKRLVYFGDTHLRLETGHAMGTQDIENKLQQVKLTPKEIKEARGVVEEIFSLFGGMVDDYYNYAQQALLAEKKRKKKKKSARQKAAVG